jgi:hypothetical protein
VPDSHDAAPFELVGRIHSASGPVSRRGHGTCPDQRGGGSTYTLVSLVTSPSPCCTQGAGCTRGIATQFATGSGLRGLALAEGLLMNAPADRP